MSDAARITAYEDALRGIAYATVAARAQVRGFTFPPAAAATLLADVEHHLASLIVLGFVPTDAGPITSSAPVTLHRRCSCATAAHRQDQCPYALE